MAGREEVAGERERTDGATRDALLRGRLLLEQPASGYRTNVDALWLAAFATTSKQARACVDLGAGVGAVGLSLLCVNAAERVALAEIDPELVAIAGRNGAPYGPRVETHAVDLREPLPVGLRHRFDLVVSNPPWAARPTRASPDPRKARARTADPDTLIGFVRAARAALGSAGRVCFVYPANELPHLLSSLRSVGLEPKRLRLVHPLPDAPARAALIEAKPARPGGLRVESAFIAMNAPGEWSDEAASILAGAFGQPSSVGRQSSLVSRQSERETSDD